MAGLAADADELRALIAEHRGLRVSEDELTRMHRAQTRVRTAGEATWAFLDRREITPREALRRLRADERAMLRDMRHVLGRERFTALFGVVPANASLIDGDIFLSLNETGWRRRYHRLRLGARHRMGALAGAFRKYVSGGKEP